MANIASSKKDARRSAERAVRNRAIRSAVKTKVTKFRRAAGEGGEELGELAERAIASLDRAAAKGVLHRNNVARRKARLAKRLNAAAGGENAAPAKPAAKGTTRGAAKGKPGTARKPAAKSRSKSAAGKTSAGKTSAKTSAKKS